MKHLIKIILLTLILWPATGWCVEIGPYDKTRSAQDGRLIVQTVKDFNRPDQDLLIKGVMTLKSGDSVSDVRKVIIKQKTYGDLIRALFRFMDSLKRGVTFLTIETHGPDNDQYLYMPSLERPRKVAASDRQNDFEDTDFTNEDMGARKIDDYTYQRRKDTKLRNRPCYKVVARSKDPSARFPKHISWIDQETFVPLQVKVYGRDNQLEKVAAAGDIRPAKRIHVPYKTVSKDLKRNHTTILEVKSAQVDTGLDAHDFDDAQMGATWKETF
jgi:hypothetical protein